MTDSSPPRQGPRWWVRDVLVSGIVAVVVSAGTIIGQKLVDDVRADRDHQISSQANEREEKLENLRFVRARSTSDPNLERPFYGLDLAGLSLAGLDLPGANLGEANLRECNLLQTNLEGASLVYATLRGVLAAGVNFKGADLTGADFTFVMVNNELAKMPAPGQPVILTEFDGATLLSTDFGSSSFVDVSLAGLDLTGANFSQATLSAVDFTGANLTDVNFGGVTYDDATRWPAGFTPPPSAE